MVSSNFNVSALNIVSLSSADRLAEKKRVFQSTLELLWRVYPKFGPNGDPDFREELSDYKGPTSYIYSAVNPKGDVVGSIIGGIQEESKVATATYLLARGGSLAIKNKVMESAEHLFAKKGVKAFFVEILPETGRSAKTNQADREFFEGRGMVVVPINYRAPIAVDDSKRMEGVRLGVVFIDKNLTPEQKSEITLTYIDKFMEEHGKTYGGQLPDNALAFQEYKDALKNATWDAVAAPAVAPAVEL